MMIPRTPARHRVLVVVLTLAVAAPATAFAQQQPADAAADLPPLIDRDIFFGDPEIAGVQLSPDGRFMTFMRPHLGVRNIWIKRAEEPFDAARPITADTTRPVPGYAWTHDASGILYIQDKGGNENFHVYAVDPDGEVEPGTGVPPARNLTPYEGVRAVLYAAPENTPNSIIVGLNDRDPRYHDVYRLDLRTGERELLYENNENIAGWEVDQQGNLRLALKVDDEANRRIYRLDGDELVEVYSCSFEETCGPLRFQKDGKRVYMITNKGEPDLTRLVLFDPATGDTELVHEDPEGEVDFGGTEWSEATDELEAVYYYGDRARVYPLDEQFEEDLKTVRAAIPEGEVFFRSTTADDRLHMVRVSSDVDPGSSYLYNRETGTVELVYRSRPELPSEHLAHMRSVRYTARDGEMVPAYLTVPKGVQAENLPTVVNPHGGPWSRDGWGYDALAQFLANRGYAVLQPNFRGSTGFGKRWLNLGNNEWGTGAMQHDITDGARWLIDEGIADAERIAIMGGSYGGFATLAGVAFTPDLYAAGVDIVGPSNIITLLNSVPPYWAAQKKIFDKRVGDVDDPEDLERLKRQSPLFSADRIEAPLLVIQGANDPRVKKAESDQMVIALSERGRAVEYLVAPDEGHGFAGRENRLTMFAQVEKFLAEHLGGRYQESMAPELQERLARIQVDVDTLELVATARLDETVQPLAFEGTALQPGTLTYRQTAEVRGQPMEMTVTREVGGTTGDSPTWLVVERTDTPSGAAIDTVWLDRETLVPVRRAVHQGAASVHLTVGADSVLGSMQTPGGERPVRASVDGDVFFEGASLQLAITTLPLAPGYATSFQTFDFMTGATEAFRLDVADVETVEVEGAAVQALRVEIVPLEGAEGPTTMWVTETQPHRVVRIETQLPARMGGAAATAELVPSG